ncbi:hypothetical protein C2869_03820 [Saccharobesus litoralis]|uniref:VWFA domain-containing protein n=1 Tax=Saccharobesus litoralis TaxID=2172099 RepID=A0A2S0VN19_9ALTE|nr:VWA domain-containing protein [Saccharobesus litoralis]AWB65617.1 hypothetical protein C2869_03820 [Saccharobesus litoralis]
MEEFVGEIWHKMLTRQVNTDCVQASVELTTLSQQLAPWYRAMGGGAAKVIEGAQPRKFNIQRRWLQRIAGSHKRFSVSWQDERSLRLPTTIALFSQSELNEFVYFWLTALAAYHCQTTIDLQQSLVNQWFIHNQNASSELLNSKPGLRQQYQNVVQALLSQRQTITGNLNPAQLTREKAIQQALISPGSVSNLPLAPGDPLPVLLWLYPAPLHLVAVNSDDRLDDFGKSAAKQGVSRQQSRKTAQRIDDAKKTDGLLIFQLESLFSWAEQVELDRCQDESLDEDVASVADDLDIITLSRQRRAGAAKIKFDLDLPAAEQDDLPLGNGIKLPEWHYKKNQLVNHYCLLQPFLADDAEPAQLPQHLKQIAQTLRKQFSCLKPQRQWLQRQPFGEELDIDAWLDCLTQQTRSQEPQNVFKTRIANSRQMACLLLADLSMSTDSALNAQQKVIDVIRDTLLLFAEALTSSGDQFAIYGFSSVKNKQVRYHLLKNFAEKYTEHARGRICAIKPGFYTRIGAAIRQSTNILKLQQTEQKLLLIISDGKPNDIDQYEGIYGIEDTRQAILEAKQAGLQPFCVTIDEKGNDYLPYLFGEKGYAIIDDVTRLPTLLPKLYLNLTGIHA